MKFLGSFDDELLLVEKGSFGAFFSMEKYPISRWNRIISIYNEV